MKLVLLLQARSEWYIAIEAGEGYTAVCSLGVPVVVFVARWSFAGSRSASEQTDGAQRQRGRVRRSACVRAGLSDNRDRSR